VNPLIKIINIVALLIVPLVVKFHAAETAAVTHTTPAAAVAPATPASK
jgi:K(+)-stimulated pyrophosphate-energized sodium pump